MNSIIDFYVEDMYRKSINVLFSPDNWGSMVGISISDNTEKICSEELNNALGWSKETYSDVREIYNYHECIDNNFSKKIQNRFLNEVYVVNYNNKFYILDAGGRGANIFYLSTEFIKVNVSENKIEYIAKSKYVDDTSENFDSEKSNSENPVKYEEKSFVLIKESDRWLVDEFTLPY